MWLFLATEVLLFAGLFLAYTLYRYKYYDVFVKGSYELGIELGGLNTAVLIISSFTMAMAVRGAQQGKKPVLIGYLIVTMMLGATFLVVKGFEYHHHWVEKKVPGFNFVYDQPVNHAEPLFHFLYFCMTGIHAVHMVAGLALLSTILYMSIKNRFSVEWNTPVEMAGLYWHLVDLVWIYLFPLLYLTGQHYKGH